MRIFWRKGDGVATIWKGLCPPPPDPSVEPEAVERSTYFDGVGERQHDGDGQTLGYGDDEDRDADDDEADEVADVGVVPGESAHDERVDREVQDQSDKVQHGDRDPYAHGGNVTFAGWQVTLCDAVCSG